VTRRQRRPDRPWWHDAVVYQVYPRSFADSDGDGVGDLRGVLAHVDHLVTLGVDALWLSPVYPSPMADNGYDISDYCDVDPVFGSLDDLDALTSALHAHDIALVMDVVVNHTSEEHPWFRDARAGGPRRDWYHWRPPRPGHTGGEPGAEPTDLQSAFGGPAWTWDEEAGAYYLHLFTPQQPDLNWDNPEVRAAVAAMMRWWLDRGVDGFRLDVINLIAKPDDLADKGELVDVDEDRLHRYLAELHAEALAGRDTVTVGEMPGATPRLAREVTDPGRRELDMVFTFEHVDLDAGESKFDLRPLHLPDLKANLAAWQEELADVGWNSLYFNNHDQPRVVSRWGDDSEEHRVASAKTIATTLHLLRGTPYVYQGEEIGLRNAPFTSIEEYRDVESRNHHRIATDAGAPEEQVMEALALKSRDHGRTPVPWDASPQGGFTTGTPWIPVNPDHDQVNVAAALADPDSVLHHYRRLIAMRHDEPLVVDGRFALLLPEDPALFAYTRTLGPSVLTVLANWSSAPVPVPEGFPDHEPDLGTHGDPDPGVLAPWESRVWRTTG
jgi:oligo-1,6-glucosidase